jgi:predicted anti-sigma-YlaC factor YlaD
VTSAPELTCQELVELVTDYLEDALTPAERARFEAHLTMCDGCRAYIEQLRDTRRLIGTLTEESLSPRMRDDLLGAFRTWRRE